MHGHGTHRTPLGRADWIYDEIDDEHYPCCTRISASGPTSSERCGNALSTWSAVQGGDCGEHQAQP